MLKVDRLYYNQLFGEGESFAHEPHDAVSGWCSARISCASNGVACAKKIGWLIATSADGVKLHRCIHGGDIGWISTSSNESSWFLWKLKLLCVPKSDLCHLVLVCRAVLIWVQRSFLQDLDLKKTLNCQSFTLVSIAGWRKIKSDESICDFIQTTI